jgi:catechol 2,3-dioxygenase-like lactoylglutathione lyase family enzyme
VLLGIDHLVIAVRDLAAAEAVLRDRLGIVCTGGGRHEAMGTFNRLAFLGDTYLELIGVFDEGLVRSSTTLAVGNAALALLETGREGLATYALASGGLEAEVAALRASGSPIGGVVHGSRRRPDGEIVRWRTAFPALGPGRPPFLIEHEYAGSEWDDEARTARTAFRHPGGGRVRLASLELPVRNLGAAAMEHLDVVGLRLGRGPVLVGDQGIALREGDVFEPPVVMLTGDPGTPPFDATALGIRWNRVPRAR